MSRPQRASHVWHGILQRGRGGSHPADLLPHPAGVCLVGLEGGGGGGGCMGGEGCAAEGAWAWCGLWPLCSSLRLPCPRLPASRALTYRDWLWAASLASPSREFAPAFTCTAQCTAPCKCLLPLPPSLHNTHAHLLAAPPAATCRRWLAPPGAAPSPRCCSRPRSSACCCRCHWSWFCKPPCRPVSPDSVPCRCRAPASMMPGSQTHRDRGSPSPLPHHHRR